MAFIAIEASFASFWNYPILARITASSRGLRIARYLCSRLRLIQFSRCESIFVHSVSFDTLVLCILAYLLIRVKTFLIRFLQFYIAFSYQMI